MPSKEKLTRDRQIIDRIIGASQVLRLGLSVEDEPTIFPLAFGYDGQSVFFHTALEGRTLEVFERGPRVCLEFEHGVRLLRDDPNPCKWSFAYESVIGRGRVVELTQTADKERGLQQVIRHYAGAEAPMAPDDVASVRVWRIALESVTGRRSHMEEG